MNPFNISSFKFSLAVLLTIVVCKLVTSQEIQYVEESFVIPSKILKEDRRISLYYPKDSSKELVALYVLDGNWNYDMVKGTVSHWVRWNLSPDFVIISIDNLGLRTRDMTPSSDEQRYPGSGLAKSFLDFISDELKIEVQKRFPRIKSDILFGHSFGGLFTLYTLKENPKLFDGYLAVSPSVWWKDRYMYGKYHFKDLDKVPFVYSTAGTNDRNNTQANEEYVSWMQENFGESLEIYGDTFEGENHFSNVPITLHHGLSKFFPKANWAQMALEVFENKGLIELKKRVAEWQTRYGIRYAIPEEALLAKALELYRADDYKNSIEMMTWLTTVSPDNYQTFYYLGYFQEKRHPNQALVNYRKALETGNIPERMKTVINRQISNLTPLKKHELSTDAVETSIAFIPGGKTAYVSKHRGRWGSNENPPSKIYRYELIDGKWTEIGLSPFSNDNALASDSDIFISHDGQEAYFISTRTYLGKEDSNPDIWMSSRTSDGWSNPTPLTAVNSEGYEASPVTDKYGNLYFSSIRSGGNGLGDFYLAKRKSAVQFEAPIPLEGAINSEFGEWNMLISPDSEWILFESSGRKEGLSPYGDLYISTYKSGSWSAPVHVKELNSTGSDLNVRFVPNTSELIFISSQELHNPTTDIYSFDISVVSDYLKK